MKSHYPLRFEIDAGCKAHVRVLRGVRQESGIGPGCRVSGIRFQDAISQDPYPAPGTWYL